MQYHTEPAIPAARADRSLEHKLTALSPHRRRALYIVVTLLLPAMLEVGVNQALNHITDYLWHFHNPTRQYLS